MSEQEYHDQDEIVARLRRIEGQVRGIQRMIEDQRDCEAIVTQLMAVRAALDRASMMILNHHLEQCLVASAGEVDRARLNRIIEFLFRFGTPPSEALTPANASEGDPGTGQGGVDAARGE